MAGLMALKIIAYLSPVLASTENFLVTRQNASSGTNASTSLPQATATKTAYIHLRDVTGNLTALSDVSVAISSASRPRNTLIAVTKPKARELISVPIWHVSCVDAAQAALLSWRFHCDKSWKDHAHWSCWSRAPTAERCCSDGVMTRDRTCLFFWPMDEDEAKTCSNGEASLDRGCIVKGEGTKDQCVSCVGMDKNSRCFCKVPHCKACKE